MSRSERRAGRDPAPRERPLYFLHIPKTAGLTLSFYLDGQYPRREICPATRWDSLLMLPAHEIDGYRLIRGHFGAMLINWLRHPPRVVTVLRDPLERAVSEWQYVLRHQEHPSHTQAMSQGPDFGQWLRDGPANPQTSALCVEHVPSGLLEELRADATSSSYRAHAALDDFAARTCAELGEQRSLDQATSRLEQCIAFGLTERFDDFVRVLAWEMGWCPPGPLSSRNVRPQGHYVPSEADADVVDRRDSLDVALLARARELFDRRWPETTPTRSDRAWEQTLAERSEILRRPLEIDLLEPFPGRGWLPPMQSNSGWVRWMGPGQQATVELPVTLPAGTRMEVHCAEAMTAELFDAWTVEVNGAPVELERCAVGRGRIGRGCVPGAAAWPRAYTRCVIRAPAVVAHRMTGAMIDDTVELAVAFTSLRFVPPPDAGAVTLPEHE